MPIVNVQACGALPRDDGVRGIRRVARTISILYPIVLLGLGVGLPRYVAIAAGRGDEESQARYLGATLWCVGLSAVVCVVI